MTSRWPVLSARETLSYLEGHIYPGPLGFSIVMYGLIALGIYSVLRHRKRMHYLYAGCFFCLLAFASAMSHHGVISLLTLPYRGAYHRLNYNLYFFLPLLAGMGLDPIWSWASRGDVHRLHRVKTGLLFLCLGVFLLQDPVREITERLRRGVVNAPVDYDNVRAMRWLEQHAERDEVILNDIDDGSFWIDDITHCRVLNPNNFWLGKDLHERRHLLSNVHKIPSDTRAWGVLDEYGIRFVYYGENLLPNGQRRLDCDALKANPLFQEVYATPRTKIFEFRPDLRPDIETGVLQ